MDVKCEEYSANGVSNQLVELFSKHCKYKLLGICWFLLDGSIIMAAMDEYAPEKMQFSPKTGHKRHVKK